MTEINERLKANARRMHEIADQQGTVSPGSQQKRVWVSSDELKQWAKTNEDAGAEIDKPPQKMGEAYSYEDLYAAYWGGHT